MKKSLFFFEFDWLNLKKKFIRVCEIYDIYDIAAIVMISLDSKFSRHNKWHYSPMCCFTSNWILPPLFSDDNRRPFTIYFTTSDSNGFLYSLKNFANNQPIG